MPTENRSSNTEQMVSARVCAYTPGQSKVELQLIPPSALPSWLELGQQVIARPAAQHQGEPMAYQWRCKTVNEGSQWRHWVDCTEEDYRKTIENPGPNSRGIIREARKLHTHSDAGEVERLRAEVEKWKGIAGRRTGERTEIMNERDDLRAQLAEALELAEKVGDASPGMKRKRLSDLLTHLSRSSASAEPSAPKCKHAACKSLGEHHPFCDFVQAIEPSAPVEIDQGIPGTSFQRLNMLANQGE